MTVRRPEKRKQRAGAASSAASSTSAQSVQKAPALAARDYETVVLVLQGGGALGAYQRGVYEALHDAGIEPDWFAGISIGAINGAILAGNAPGERLDKLRAFWERISTPALPLPKEAFDWQRQWLDTLPKSGMFSALADGIGAASSLLHGQSGFFVPRVPPPYATLTAGAAATSFYSTAPLRQTLESMIDFDRLNHASVRYVAGAVNVRTGNFVYFDNRKMRIRVEHVMASGALPPAFAAVEIDGEHYWDGGLVSNTPLEYVSEETPRRDTLALQVDLWSARGAVPKTLADVYERTKDIQYSSRTRQATDSALQRQRLRTALGKLAAQLPGGALPEELAPWICSKVLNVIHLIYQSKAYEEQYKDYAFGPLSTRAHWTAGLRDMQRTLGCARYFAMPSREVGVATHDVHR